MDIRYCDSFRPVDEDAYLRDFIRAVEHKDLSYVKFIVPIIKEQQRLVGSAVDPCGHYLQISEEDSVKYEQVLAHGLLLASHHGNLNTTLYLLEQGANVNARNQAGDTALIKACERGYEDVVKVLLEFGADINKTNLVGSTALQWVARMSDTRLHMVDLLLSYDTIAVDQASHKRGRTALHCSAESDPTGMVCRSLLDKSAYVNIQDREGVTPLHLAAERGLIANVKTLIEYGAHINKQSIQFSLTPLHLAMQEGHADVAILLLNSGADLSMQDSFGQTALDRMRRYSKLTPKYEFSTVEDYIDTELVKSADSQYDRLKRVFTVLCELITEGDNWTSLFEELFQEGGCSGEVLEETITRIPLRTSESSLSVLLHHLLNVWHSKYKRTATFWILMRALRDHGMSPLADRMITEFWTEDKNRDC